MKKVPGADLLGFLFWIVFLETSECEAAWPLPSELQLQAVILG